jgi:hypothetical protein
MTPKTDQPCAGQAPNLAGSVYGRHTYLTLADVAGDMHVTPRWLREVIRRHQIPVLRRGRVIRFDDLALRALEEALRSPSKSSAAPTPARSPSPGVRSPGNASAAARKATILLSPAPGRRACRGR